MFSFPYTIAVEILIFCSLLDGISVVTINNTSGLDFVYGFFKIDTYTVSRSFYKQHITINTLIIGLRPAHTRAHIVKSLYGSFEQVAILKVRI